MKIRTNRIAPLALATVLAFGAAACEGEDTVNDEIQDVEDGANEAETEMDQELTDEDEVGDADEDEGVETDDATTEE